jgi:hypothetical protein
MHLVTNNCWTFAFQLYSFLSQEDSVLTPRIEKHTHYIVAGGG